MTVQGPVFTGKVDGKILVMVGGDGFTVRFTVMFCEWLALDTPEATTVIFAT